MIPADSISITFEIPAADHLGREAVVGKVRFLADLVELNWRMASNVFRGGKDEMKVIRLPYGEIEQVELKKRWFRYRTLVLYVGDPALVAEIPNVEMGKLEMEIDERSAEEAKQLASLIDFKRSAFILDEQEKRIDALRSS